jgi:hypothetical protein
MEVLIVFVESQKLLHKQVTTGLVDPNLELVVMSRIDRKAGIHRHGSHTGCCSGGLTP